MGLSHQQIEKLKREISAVDHKIELLYAEFGQLAFTRGQLINTNNSKRLTQEITQLFGQLKQEQNRLEHLEALASQLDNVQNRLKQLRALSEQTKNLLDVLYGRVGVIAWEEYLSGALSDSLQEFVKAYVTHHGELEELKRKREQLQERENGQDNLLLRFKRGHLERSQRKMSDKSHRLYVEVGQEIAQAELIRELKSSVASELEENYQALYNERITWESEFNHADGLLKDSRNELEEAGVAGPVEKKIQELREAVKNLNERQRRLANAYGREVRRNLLQVTGENFELLSREERHLQAAENERETLENQIEILQKEAEIEEQSLLIGQDQERISYIRESIANHQRQIDEIESSIQRRQQRIATLKSSCKALREQSQQ